MAAAKCFFAGTVNDRAGVDQRLMQRVGPHISIRHGYAGAARTAAAIGAAAFQYFPKNPRGLAVKPVPADDAAACKAVCAEFGIVSVAHTTYATNLAAEGSLRDATIRSLRNDLDIAEACGSIGVVVHFGVWRADKPALEGYASIIDALNEVLREWTGSALLLIENQAGQGANAGTTFDEWSSIRQLSAYPEKIGFCLDTCHLYASGVWNGTNWSELQRRGRELGVLEQVRAIHFNDSVWECGSRKDRHANIGSGRIGADALRDVLHTEQFSSLPVILETPAPAGGSHRDEIRLVRSLLPT